MTMKDPDFLAAAQKSGFDIDPVPGAELQRLAQGDRGDPKTGPTASQIIALADQQKNSAFPRFRR